MVAVKRVENDEALSCERDRNAARHKANHLLSFQAATGLVAVHITTVSANPPTSGHPINENKRLD